MNYRHAFHAGNHADVLKHLVLTRLIALLSRKEAPFAYLDSHAGLGLYDLQGDQASRTGEYLEGIARLWQAEQLPDAVEAYLEVVRAMNPDGELRYYPGSPELARLLSREQIACSSTRNIRKTGDCSRTTCAVTVVWPCTWARAGTCRGR